MNHYYVLTYAVIYVAMRVSIEYYNIDKSQESIPDEYNSLHVSSAWYEQLEEMKWLTEEYKGNVQKVCSTAVEYFTDSWVQVVAKLSHWNNIYKHILDLHQIRSRLSDLYPIRCRKRGTPCYTLNIPTPPKLYTWFFFPSPPFLTLTMTKWKAFWWEACFSWWLTTSSKYW